MDSYRTPRPREKVLIQIVIPAREWPESIATDSVPESALAPIDGENDPLDSGFTGCLDTFAPRGSGEEIVRFVGQVRPHLPAPQHPARATRADLARGFHGAAGMLSTHDRLLESLEPSLLGDHLAPLSRRIGELLEHKRLELT